MAGRSDQVDSERGLEYLLLEVTRQMHDHFERVSEQFGLTPPQATALRRMGCGAPQRELAEHMGCDASYITGLVDALEARDLVERQPDPKDRRIKQLVVTEKGALMREQLRRALLAESPLATYLDQGEKRNLAALLQKLLAGYTDSLSECP